MLGKGNGFLLASCYADAVVFFINDLSEYRLFFTVSIYKLFVNIYISRNSTYFVFCGLRNASLHDPHFINSSLLLYNIIII